MLDICIIQVCHFGSVYIHLSKMSIGEGFLQILHSFLCYIECVRILAHVTSIILLSLCMPCISAEFCFCPIFCPICNYCWSSFIYMAKCCIINLHEEGRSEKDKAHWRVYGHVIEFM